jgi:FAD-dependent urate hydroxylase
MGRRCSETSMEKKTHDCNVTVIGAGPYGLSSAAYLRAAGIETRIFGEPMSFWERNMPRGMCLRSNWAASHIADPRRELTLDAFCLQNGNHVPKPIPLKRFVDYGHWYQRRAVPDVDRRAVVGVDAVGNGFQVRLENGEEFTSRRVVVATGIGSFAKRPVEFDGILSALASHTSEHNDLTKFRGQRIAVIGAGQSALESATLFKEAGIAVEVIARERKLNWVGLHPALHHLGPISSLLYSKRDVGPAGISRLVDMPNLFRCLPQEFQDRTAYRAIRPAGAAWLQPRLEGVPITLGRKVVSATPVGAQLRLKLDDDGERVVDHALLATGFRVEVSKCKFLCSAILKRLQMVDGYPVLKRGLESSIPGLHFVGKTAARSFGPILGFVSGAEFAATELVHSIKRNDSLQ